MFLAYIRDNSQELALEQRVVEDDLIMNSLCLWLMMMTSYSFYETPPQHNTEKKSSSISPPPCNTHSDRVTLYGFSSKTVLICQYIRKMHVLNNHWQPLKTVP